MQRFAAIPGLTYSRTLIGLLLRGTALFLGIFTLWSLVFRWLSPMNYDANIWWIDLRAFAAPLRWGLPIVFAMALLHRAVWPAAAGRSRTIRDAMLVMLIVVLLLNTLNVWRLSIDHAGTAPGRLSGVMLGRPVPLSAVLALLVLFMLIVSDPRRERATSRRVSRTIGVVGCAAIIAVTGALAQMFFFGESDYRRPADAIVVYGCKAYANGKPSQALADRVHTACELYHQGLAPIIVMSGGPVDESIHETLVMADYAVAQGVPRDAILLDRLGHDTLATAENLQSVLHPTQHDKPLRVLAVSHDYHLPRVKLSLEREGITAYTVPCEVRRGLPGKPYFVVRETAAWWYYYFAPSLAVISR